MTEEMCIKDLAYCLEYIGNGVEYHKDKNELGVRSDVLFSILRVLEAINTLGVTSNKVSEPYIFLSIRVDKTYNKDIKYILTLNSNHDLKLLRPIVTTVLKYGISKCIINH